MYFMFLLYMFSDDSITLKQLAMLKKFALQFNDNPRFPTSNNIVVTGRA